MAGIRTENKIYEVGIYCRLSKDDGTDNESASINVNIKMYIFDHLRMYKFAHSSSCIIYSLKRYDFPVMFMTCA